jgi:hypothetical protein
MDTAIGHQHRSWSCCRGRHSQARGGLRPGGRAWGGAGVGLASSWLRGDRADELGHGAGKLGRRGGGVGELRRVGKLGPGRAPAAARGQTNSGGSPRRDELQRRPAGVAGGDAWWRCSRKETLPNEVLTRQCPCLGLSIHGERVGADGFDDFWQKQDTHENLPRFSPPRG